MDTPEHFWTESEQQMLRDLWPIKSASEIAKLVNRTRNAVIGAANRLGLVNKKKGGANGGGRKRKDPPAWKSAPKPVLLPVVAVPIKAPVAPQPWLGKGVSLLEATQHQCKAVIGSTSPGAATVCGQPVDVGSFYEFCPGHKAIYLQPAWRR